MADWQWEFAIWRFRADRSIRYQDIPDGSAGWRRRQEEKRGIVYRAVVGCPIHTGNSIWLGRGSFYIRHLLAMRWPINF